METAVGRRFRWARPRSMKRMCPGYFANRIEGLAARGRCIPRGRPRSLRSAYSFANLQGRRTCSKGGITVGGDRYQAYYATVDLDWKHGAGGRIHGKRRLCGLSCWTTRASRSGSRIPPRTPDFRSSTWTGTWSASRARKVSSPSRRGSAKSSSWLVNGQHPGDTNFYVDAAIALHCWSVACISRLAVGSALLAACVAVVYRSARKPLVQLLFVRKVRAGSDSSLSSMGRISGSFRMRA